MENSFKADKDSIGKRLDVYISENLGITRSQIKSYYTDMTVNGDKKKLSYIIKENDDITITIPRVAEKNIDDNQDRIPKPENIDIDIVYEDKYLVVINKPSGMSVHCSTSEMKGTLVNALLYHIKDFDFYGDKSRAGIIHRLDKDTSGLIIVGKNANIVSEVQEQFKDRSVKKIYHAITSVAMKVKTLNINLPIGRHPVYRKKMTVIEPIKGNMKHSPKGREAITFVNTLENFKNNSLVEVNLKTGRTHQIRVHLSYKGYPIAGDKIYSKSATKYTNLMLNAKKLEFIHPTTDKVMSFEVEYPSYFLDFLSGLRRDI